MITKGVTKVVSSGGGGGGGSEPTDGDKGDIVVTNTGTTWTLDTGAVIANLGYIPTSVTGLTGVQTVAAFKTGLSLVKADVGLGSVDNTADTAKSVASAATLTTARTINGVSFNGSADITISAVDTATPRLAESAASAYGLTLIDDINAATARATLGLGTAATVATGTSGATVPFLNTANTWSGRQTIQAANQLSLRASATSAPTVIHRHDGSDYYFLLTDPETSASTTWNALRPLTISATTGRLTSSNGQTFGGGTTLTGALTATTATFSGAVSASNLSGTNTGDQTSVTGNAGTATKLATARAINGVDFDGSADITIKEVASTFRVTSAATPVGGEGLEFAWTAAADRGNITSFNRAAGTYGLLNVDASTITLFHAGSAKLATTSTGVSITGNVVASGSVTGTNLSGSNTGDQTAATLNYTPAGTGAVTRTSKAKLDQIVYPEDFGAVGDGVTDDAANLQLALNTGKRVFIDPTKTYAIGSQLTPPSGGGLVGYGKLLMLTGAGKFAFADYTGSATAKAGIYIAAKSNVKIEAKIEMQANAAIRTCSAIWVQDSTNVNLDVEISGFKEMQAGAIEWNSNVDGSVKAYIHTIYTNSNTLPSMQLTGLSVDNNRTASTNSRRLRFDVHAKNIEMGAAAIAAHGYQTDGVNLQGASGTGGSWSGHSGTVLAENVHEPLDIFCDHCVVDVTARDCLFGIKVIHGASHNVIRATVHRPMKAGVYIGGSGGAQGTNNNQIYATVTAIGENPGFGDTCGALIEGDVTGQGASRNFIQLTASGNGTDFDYGCAISGSLAVGNTIEYEATGFLQGGSRLYAGSGAGNVMRRRRRGLVRAYQSATVNYGADVTVVFNTVEENTYGEYNAVTGVWTSAMTGKVRVKYHSNQSVNSGEQYGSYIRKGVNVASRKTQNNMSAGGLSIPHEHEKVIDVIPGDTIFIRSGNTVAAMPIFGTAENTFLEIEEL